MLVQYDARIHPLFFVVERVESAKLSVIGQFFYSLHTSPLIRNKESFIHMRERSVITTYSFYWGFQIQETFILKISGIAYNEKNMILMHIELNRLDCKARISDNLSYFE